MLHKLVGGEELAQVVANHLPLDFHLVEGLATLDPPTIAHHLGHGDHVLQEHLRIMPWRGSFLLGLAQVLQQ